MEAINIVMPVILYTLTSSLLVILIVLGIKLIKAVDKFTDLADNVSRKVNSLNSFFSIIDMVTDKVSFLSDRLVDGITSLLSKIFTRKEKRKDDKDE